MKKLQFTLIPLCISLLYVAGQLFASFVIRRTFFSSTFIAEVILYALFAVLYILVGYKIGKLKYVGLAIVGLLLGITVFIAVGGGIFLLSDLSI
jgi:hypothetical protein